MHCVLIKWHPMVGCDFHTDLMPVPPPPTVQPSPWHPHLTGHVLWGWSLGTIAPKEKALGIEIIHMGSDIANGIPHIPLPPTHFLLALLYTGLSGSKSHFGPSNVQTPLGPIGAALLVVVNLNLNCGEITPTPTGVVIAPNTVMAHMTLGDILGGLFAMVTDAVICAALSWAGRGLSNRFSGVAGQLLAGPLMGFMLGSPLGKSGLDVLQGLTPDSWNDELDTLSHIPGFPGSVGTLGSYPSDGNRYWGNLLGDSISGGETNTDRLFGNDGAYASQNAANAADQPANTSGTGSPADGITNNPSVEDF